MSELTTSQAVRAYETHPNVLNRLILLERLKAPKECRRTLAYYEGKSGTLEPTTRTQDREV